LKVPVSGQDASPTGLQNVLLGKQTTTVWKPYTLIATAASDLAIALLNGETPTADKALADGTPYIAVTPNSVGPDAVKDVVAAGDAKYDEVCTAAVMAACEEFGVTA
jgi:D-xylose transport system substrate-binding protein